MANTLLTIDMITNEALAVLENNLSFTKNVNREFDDYFGKEGAQIGDTLNIRKPVRYTTRTGPALQVQNSTETYTTVTLTQKGCDMAFSTKDLTLAISQFSDRFLKPALASVANTIDYDGMALAKSVYQSVGTAGTTPADLMTYLQAGVKLDNAAAPNDDMRAAVLNPIAQATLVDALKGLFNDTSEVSKQYRDGTMGRTAGLKFSRDQNVYVHTAGTLDAATSLTVNTAPSSGASSISIAGFTAGDTLAVGDVFTIAGVYSVNPQSRQTTGQLQQFVVTTAVTATAGANTVTFSPSIVYDPTGQQNQNVNSLPSAGAAVTLYASSGVVSPQNLVFHRDAFTVACADLILPRGVDMAARKRSPRLNMSMRAVTAYDVNNDRLPTRIDILYGWSAMRPELACRVWG